MRYNNASYFHIIYLDDKKVWRNRGPDEREGFPTDSQERNANAPSSSFPWIFACRRRDVRRVRFSRNERRQPFRLETLTICSSSLKATKLVVSIQNLLILLSVRRKSCQKDSSNIEHRINVAVWRICLWLGLIKLYMLGIRSLLDMFY